MLRTIEYTVSPGGIVPLSPQFAGVQGENGATELKFIPDAALSAEIAALADRYDSLTYRVDCIDGAARAITGSVNDYAGGTVSFPLESTVTQAGGRLNVCLILSGCNNDTAASTVLYSFPVSLYFRNFPLSGRFEERAELNKAVLQTEKLRDETYDIAASVLEMKGAVDALAKEAEDSRAAAQDACTAAETAAGESEASAQDASGYAQTTVAYAQSAAQSAESAAGYAGTALTYSVQAQGYAETAQSHANTAQGHADAALAAQSSAESSAENAAASAQNAAQSLTELLAAVGDINAVLAQLVTV